MSAVSTSPAERARKSHSAVLRALAEPGKQVAIAAATGTSETTISRFKTEQLETFCSYLAHAGLKVVPSEMQCFPPEKVQALLTLARDHLQTIETPAQLVWE